MTREQFDNHVTIGTEVIVKRGTNQGMEAVVVFIDKETRTVLLKSIDGQKFSQMRFSNPQFRLTNYREIAF